MNKKTIVEHNGRYYLVTSFTIFGSCHSTTIYSCTAGGDMIDCKVHYYQSYQNEAEMRARHAEIIADIGAALNSEYAYTE